MPHCIRKTSTHRNEYHEGYAWGHASRYLESGYRIFLLQFFAATTENFI